MSDIKRLPKSTMGRPGDRYVEYKGGTVAVTDARQLAMYSLDPVSTDSVDLVSYEIVITRKHLENKYIDDKLRAKGLDTQQICEARSRVREYVDLLLKDKDVDMTDDAYDMLVNIAIHLIGESSKAE